LGIDLSSKLFNAADTTVACTAAHPECVWRTVFGGTPNFARWANGAATVKVSLTGAAVGTTGGPVVDKRSLDTAGHIKTAGKHTVTFRSAGKIKGALLDLKELRLAPAAR